MIYYDRFDAVGASINGNGSGSFVRVLDYWAL
jgi:hypothetical protein